MSGLKLIAAGICGSALTLAVSTLAQAPKQPAWKSAPIVECPQPQDLFHIEHNLDKMSEKLDAIAADQKSAADWAHFMSSDLSSIAISLRSR